MCPSALLLTRMSTVSGSLHGWHSGQRCSGARPEHSRRDRVCGNHRPTPPWLLRPLGDQTSGTPGRHSGAVTAVRMCQRGQLHLAGWAPPLGMGTMTRVAKEGVAVPRLGTPPRTPAGPSLRGRWLRGAIRGTGASRILMMVRSRSGSEKTVFRLGLPGTVSATCGDGVSRDVWSHRLLVGVTTASLG